MISSDLPIAWLQAAEEERQRIEDEERREWESAQGAGPRAEVRLLPGPELQVPLRQPCPIQVCDPLS